ncbi:MAG: flagellar hook protein FlgE [Nitrospirota bacterium]
MGLSTALFTGVSGLNINGTGLSVVGDNIANTNTTGFKGSRAAFGDILSSSLGGGSSFQIGRGAALQAVQTNFTQGTLETTSNPLDLAIEGDGFFIVRDQNGAQFYTRAGQFKLDKSGDIVNPEGLRLQGYLSQQGGVLGTINVSSLNSPANDTSAITISANLSSGTHIKRLAPSTENFYIDNTNQTIVYDEVAGGAGIVTTIAPGSYTGAQLANQIKIALEAAAVGKTNTNTYTVNYVPASNTFSIQNDLGGSHTINFRWDNVQTTAEHVLGFSSTALDAVAVGATLPSDFAAIGFDPAQATNTSDFSTSITTYDSLGNSHLITVYFRKTGESTVITGGGTGNRWDWYAVVPSTDATSGVSTVAAHGSLEFDTTGKLVSDSQGINDFDFAGGVTQSQLISFNFGTSLGEGGSGLDGTTQFGTPNSVLFQSQDGYTAGSLQSLIVAQNGAMTGVFTNGQTQKVADVALARFIAPTELTKTGRNLFTESNGSGVPIIGTAGTSGRGRIFANSLEASNVDLADEFVKMIAMQRGFQANTKVISATDELLTELGNIKR